MQFDMSNSEIFLTLSKLMGAQWKQAGRKINAHKKGQMVVKLVSDRLTACPPQERGWFLRALSGR